MGDRPGHKFRGNQWSGARRSSGSGGATVLKDDWKAAGGAKIITSDDPDAAGRLIASELRDDRDFQESLAHFGEKYDEQKAAENWSKTVEGRIVTDPDKIAAVQSAVKANQESPVYRDIVKAQGGEGVIVLLQETSDQSNLMHGSTEAGQRVGVVTGVFVGGKLSDWEHSKDFKTRDDISPGAGPRGLGGLLRHELGHSVAHRVDKRPGATRRLKDSYDKIKSPKTELSYYAGFSGFREAFPEALAIGSSRKYKRSNWSPDAANFIDAVIAESRT